MAVERIVNGGFDSDLANWTDQDIAGGVSSFDAGKMDLETFSGGDAALREQQVTITPNVLCEVSFDLVEIAGIAPFFWQVGSTSLDNDIVNINYADDGSKTESFTTTFSTIFFQFNVSNVIGDNWTVDNVSLLQKIGGPKINFIT